MESVPRGPILVVDDDAKILRLVRMYLEREGYRVIDAQDGRAALAAIERADPALVILDIMLPEVDGLAVIKAVRRTDPIPIVVLSSLGRADDLISGLAAGACRSFYSEPSTVSVPKRLSETLCRDFDVEWQFLAIEEFH